MSALRIASPGVPAVLVPVDGGMRPYRGASFIGGTLVTEAPPTPRAPSLIPPARLAQMAAYKAQRRAQAKAGGA